MSSVANVNAPPDQRPSNIPVDPTARIEGGYAIPVEVIGSPNAENLQRPKGLPRPMAWGITYGFGMLGWRRPFSGAYGVTATLLPPDMMGSQRPWAAWTPTSERNAPESSWERSLPDVTAPGEMPTWQ